MARKFFVGGVRRIDLEIREIGFYSYICRKFQDEWDNRVLEIYLRNFERG
jgi:hypothetical protein